MYGFGNGPCVGYCYDINNRITVWQKAEGNQSSEQLRHEKNDIPLSIL
jgi:hypothetical protein